MFFRSLRRPKKEESTNENPKATNKPQTIHGKNNPDPRLAYLQESLKGPSDYSAINELFNTESSFIKAIKRLVDILEDNKEKLLIDFNEALALALNENELNYINMPQTNGNDKYAKERERKKAEDQFLKDKKIKKGAFLSNDDYQQIIEIMKRIIKLSQQFKKFILDWIEHPLNWTEPQFNRMLQEKAQYHAYYTQYYELYFTRINSKMSWIQHLTEEEKGELSQESIRPLQFILKYEGFMCQGIKEIKSDVKNEIELNETKNMLNAWFETWSNISANDPPPEKIEEIKTRILRMKDNLLEAIKKIEPNRKTFEIELNKKLIAKEATNMLDDWLEKWLHKKTQDQPPEKIEEIQTPFLKAKNDFLEAIKEMNPSCKDIEIEVDKKLITLKNALKTWLEAWSNIETKGLPREKIEGIKTRTSIANNNFLKIIQENDPNILNNIRQKINRLDSMFTFFRRAGYAAKFINKKQRKLKFDPLHIEPEQKKDFEESASNSIAATVVRHPNRATQMMKKDLKRLTVYFNSKEPIEEAIQSEKPFLERSISHYDTPPNSRRIPSASKALFNELSQQKNKETVVKSVEPVESIAPKPVVIAPIAPKMKPKEIPFTQDVSWSDTIFFLSLVIGLFVPPVLFITIGTFFYQQLFEKRKSDEPPVQEKFSPAQKEPLSPGFTNDIKAPHEEAEDSVKNISASPKKPSSNESKEKGKEKVTEKREEDDSSTPYAKSKGRFCLQNPPAISSTTCRESARTEEKTTATLVV